jgi:hypothetical protein
MEVSTAQVMLDKLYKSILVSKMKQSISWCKWEFIRAANRIGFDRRVLFNDLSRVHPGFRKSRSKVLNFYSAANNIGNYLPVLAIHQKLGFDVDCWNVHDKNIDYDFINQNYESVVIGGAGLLHPVFAHFWTEFSEKCTVPFIIWGVGSCVPDNLELSYDVKKRGGGVFCDGMMDAFSRADLINVRDYVTADIVGQDNVSVTACPTLLLLRGYEIPEPPKDSNPIIYAPHSGLGTRADDLAISHALTDKFGSFYFTENEQSLRFGLWDLIDKYKSADLVITSRLHGAIIAWSLGVPFLALSRDMKMDGFANFAGLRDVVFRDVDTLLSRLDSVPVFDNADCHRVAADFADTAFAWVNR